MEGCYKLYSNRQRDASEKTRLDLNLMQAKSVHNYTKVGFLKRKIPKGLRPRTYMEFMVKILNALYTFADIWEPLIKFYESHKNEKKIEAWSPGYTYVNHWESPTYVNGTLLVSSCIRYITCSPICKPY